MPKNNFASICQFPQETEYSRGNDIVVTNFVYEHKPADYGEFYHEDHYTFFLITHGECNFTTDYETFSLKRGDCCFTFPQKRYKFSECDKSRMLYISFINPAAKILLNSLDITYVSPVRGGFEDKIAFFLKEFNRSKLLEAPYLIPHSLLEYALSFFVRPQSLASPKPDNLTLVNNILKYVDENYAEKISLEEIAKENYVSYNYLSQTFAKTVGTTFSKYLVGVRLRHAVDMLIRSDLSISEISYKCGFNNVNYFIKTFKSYYELTPNEYRKKGVGRHRK